MKKAIAPKKPVARKQKPKVQNSINKLENGLGDAIGYQSNLMGWGTPNNPNASAVSQLETLEKNTRWYLISNLRQLLAEVYVEFGIVKNFIDVPVNDALRGGVDITTKELTEEQIDELQVAIDREGLLTTTGQAMKWNRLFGGAAILIITDQDSETPLDFNAIGPDSMLEFRAVDLWELFFTAQNTYNEELQMPESEFYNYYSKKVHASRVMLLKGLACPSFLRPKLRGWGVSILESVIKSFNHYIKMNELIYELIDEAKVDVYKIKDLASTLMSPNGTTQVRTRLDMANYQKNFQNAIAMDSEDSWEQKTLTFAGISEILKDIRIGLASELGMPLTKIFGLSATGFNSGVEDLENYNAMVEGEIRGKCKYDILRVLEIQCQKMFGMIPSDLKIDFKPLRVLSAEQEEATKTLKFTRVLQSKQANMITDEEFRDSCNRDNLLGVHLDPAGLAELQDEKEQNKLDMMEGMNTPEGDPESLKNESDAFLKAAYEADRGADKITHENIQKVDKQLWAEAERISKKESPNGDYKFTIWIYKHLGGKFGEKL